MSKRNIKTFYSKDLRQANAKRFAARGSAATERGALLAAVAKVHAKLFKRVDIYGVSGRLLWTVFTQDGRINITRIEAKSGKLCGVDSDVGLKMTHLYLH